MPPERPAPGEDCHSAPGGDWQSIPAAAPAPTEDCHSATAAPPPTGTVERWAWDYISSTDLPHKLSPPPPPTLWEASPPPRRIPAPGRPATLTLTRHSAKTPGPEAIRSPAKRAQLVHTFLHHELQAAELMAWAVLAFADSPRPFRTGLLHIAMDEVRHMALYQAHLAALGHRFGDFPVRDWFWERVPSALTPAQFVAVLGVGFEGANLDHTARFADRFRAIGDHEGARIQDVVGAEEIPHVRFALHWLTHFAQDVTLSTWVAQLPAPLSPILMRGKPLNRDSRLRAGFTEPFLEGLLQWSERPPGS